MPPTKFAEWRRLLARIEVDQIAFLDRHASLFRLFQETIRAAHLPKRSVLQLVTDWMALNYISFATTWIRKTMEPAKKGWNSVSFLQLLYDLQSHAALLTRTRFRAMYRRHSVPDRVADAQWLKHFGRGGSVSQGTIARDIRSLERAERPIRRFANKQVAHTENDRRKWTKIELGSIRKAAEKQIAVFRKYNLLIRGRVYRDELLEEERTSVRLVFEAFWHGVGSAPGLVRRPAGVRTSSDSLGTSESSG